MALTIIAALLSVSTVPLLPATPVCAHAAERMRGDCHSCHDGQAMQDMAHSMRDGGKTHHAMSGQDEASVAHDHQRELTAAEKECRIECGCGCHHSVDGFPTLLAPHVTAAMGFDSPLSVARAAMAVTASPEESVRRIQLPPPQRS